MKRTSLTKTMKSEISRLYGYVCLNCGSDTDIELHHIVPLCNGGRNEARNIVPLCCECHCKAHDKGYKKRGYKGRKPVMAYEVALPVIERYFAKEVGNKEACRLIGELTGREGYSLTKGIWGEFRKRYIKENKIKYFFNDLDTVNAQPGRVASLKATCAENREKKATTKGVRP